MFLVPLQTIIAMAALAINERMTFRIDYLIEAARVLREVYTEITGRRRIAFADCALAQCTLQETEGILTGPGRSRLRAISSIQTKPVLSQNASRGDSCTDTSVDTSKLGRCSCVV
jgi:hypothetical protein